MTIGRKIQTSDDGWVVSLKNAPIQPPGLDRCLHDGPCAAAIYAQKADAEKALAGHAFRAQFEVRRVTVTFYVQEIEENSDERK